MIAATDGQFVGYLLQHPTLSLVGRPYSFMPWDEAGLRTQMTVFHASHLFVVRDPNLDPVVQESAFLAALANRKSPSWLEQVVCNRDLCLYRVQ